MQTNFSHLSQYIGRDVRINRGGPESQVGKLLEVKQDFLTVLGKKNTVVYYQTTHLKSVTINTKQELEVTVPSEEPVLEWVRGKSFNQLLQQLVSSPVQINRGGPEKVEGVLLEVKNDHIIVEKEAELVYIALFHVKSVSNTVAASQHEESGNDQENDKKNDKKKNQGASLFSDNWQPVSKK